MNKKSYPITSSLKTAETVSVITALLLAGTSLASLLFPSALYPSEEIRQGMLSNDVVNLIIGVPAIIACLLLARRENLAGLLFWPGALYYVTYNSVAAVVARPSTVLFVLHLVLTLLSVAGLILLLRRINMPAVKKKLTNKVSERFAGATLTLFGAAFFFLAMNIFLNGKGSPSEFATAIADLIAAPAWMIGGVQLLRRKPLGYALGGGLLFHAATLFLGLLVYFFLQPLVAGVPFPLDDFIAILPMALVCFVPFGLFIRGVVKSKE